MLARPNPLFCGWFWRQSLRTRASTSLCHERSYFHSSPQQVIAETSQYSSSSSSSLSPTNVSASSVQSTTNVTNSSSPPHPVASPAADARSSRTGVSSQSSFTPHPANRISSLKDSVWTKFTPLAAQYGAINLSQGIPTTPVAPFILEELSRVCVDGKHHQYCRSAGHLDLVQHIAQHYTKQLGVPVHARDNVLITTGATQGLFLFFQAFLEPEDEIILFEPSYDAYVPQIRMTGAVPIPVPIRDTVPRGSNRRAIHPVSPSFTLDLQELERKITPKTKALIINNPQNPLGKVFSNQELAGICHLAKKYNLIVLSDEVYDRLVFGGAAHIPIASFPGMWERTLTLGSVGKTFNLTGWKVGWAVGPSSILNAVQVTQQFIPFSVCSPLQYALSAIWPRAEKEHFYQQQIEEMSRLRTYMMDILSGFNLTIFEPQASYFTLVDITNIDFPRPSNSPNTRDVDFCEWMTQELRVTPLPVSAFYLPEHSALGEKYVRMCFCKREHELDTVQRRLEGLKQYLTD
eukprot:m.120275 g.120275  ORF g.120275 m.120275 type:complete len:519 (-) comp23226_c2_seq1:36-1592(-)